MAEDSDGSSTRANLLSGYGTIDQPEDQKDRDHIWGFISRGPPSSRVAAGSRTLLECLTSTPQSQQWLPK